MSKKDIIYLAISGLLFAVIGLLLLNQFGGGGSDINSVEAVRPIEAEFDQTGINLLNGEGDREVVDYTPKTDNGQDFGTNNPFN